MKNLPIYVPAIFILITMLTLWFYYRASNKTNLVLGISMTWLLVHGIIAYSGFYLVSDTIPPRIVYMMAPVLLTIVLLFATKWGRNFIDSMNEVYFTWLHVIRVPVEIVLWVLFIYKGVPQLMTFEGRNFDILSGVTAPFVAYYGYHKRKLGKTFLLVWNFACLALLLNIVVIAILAAPFFFQRLAFDQPNVAILHFPFIWLPGFIVPVVLFSHLVCIRKLIMQKNH
jgi:hypothetical protein